MTDKDVARKVFDFMQLHLYARPDEEYAKMKFSDWMKLQKILLKVSPELLK